MYLSKEAKEKENAFPSSWTFSASSPLQGDGRHSYQLMFCGQCRFLSRGLDTLGSCLLRSDRFSWFLRKSWKCCS